MPVPGAVSDPSSIDTSEIRIGEIDAYLARAVGDGPHGGIIVIHEAFGMVPHISDLARRFAAAGFNAIAPNLYTRTGSPDPTDFPAVFQAMFGKSDAETVADLDLAAAHLRGLDDSNGKVGVIGFCSGGRQTLLYACSSAAPDAAIDCWGGFVDRATQDDVTTPNRPTPVRELAAGASCPIFLAGGADDQNPSPEVLADVAERLRAAGKDVTLKVWDGAGHAFLADYRPSYAEPQAHELWADILDFFGAHLR
ncbi:MAG: dienelactone hydrolase family protein [Acidimicrobiales bacterium]